MQTAADRKGRSIHIIRDGEFRPVTTLTGKFIRLNHIIPIAGRRNITAGIQPRDREMQWVFVTGEGDIRTEQDIGPVAGIASQEKSGAGGIGDGDVIEKQIGIRTEGQTKLTGTIRSDAIYIEISRISAAKGTIREGAVTQDHRAIGHVETRA